MKLIFGDPESIARDKRGERQVKCSQCGLWVWPTWKLDIKDHDERTGHKFVRVTD